MQVGPEGNLGCGPRCGSTAAAVSWTLDLGLPRARTPPAHPTPRRSCLFCETLTCRVCSALPEALRTTLLQALRKDPVTWLLLWEQYNYSQIGGVMGYKKESGLGVGKIAIFIQMYFG